MVAIAVVEQVPCSCVAHTGPHVDDEPEQAASARQVVAVVLTYRGRIGLFRRSAHVDHDQGRWHCVTGYLEAGVSAEQHALQELFEETGLRVADLGSFTPGVPLSLPDRRGNTWTVYTFVASTTQRRLRLNEEHDAHRWVKPIAVARFSNRVEWLDDVLRAAPGA